MASSPCFPIHRSHSSNSATASASVIDRVSVAMTSTSHDGAPPALSVSREVLCPWQHAMPAISDAPVMSSAMTMVIFCSYD